MMTFVGKMTKADCCDCCPSHKDYIWRPQGLNTKLKQCQKELAAAQVIADMSDDCGWLSTQYYGNNCDL